MKKIYCLGAAFSLVLSGMATAGDISINQLQLADSPAPTVTINFTDANGTGSNTQSVYADPQVSLNTTAPLFYCVDLWHDNYVNQSYTLHSDPSLSFAATSSYDDTNNRVAWLLTQDQSTTDARAAVQLAIWDTIDNKGFSYSSSDTTINSDYTNLLQFTGYSSSTPYAATFYVTDAGYSDQNMVIGGSDFTQASVPEPGSLVLGTIGTLLVAGIYGWRRFA